MIFHIYPNSPVVRWEIFVEFSSSHIDMRTRGSFADRNKDTSTAKPPKRARTCPARTQEARNINEEISMRNETYDDKSQGQLHQMNSNEIHDKRGNKSNCSIGKLPNDSTEPSGGDQITAKIDAKCSLDASSEDASSMLETKMKDTGDGENDGNVDAKENDVSFAATACVGDVMQTQTGISALEMQVQRNIEERMKMLRAFNIDSMKEQLKETFPRSSVASKSKKQRVAPSVSLAKYPSRRSQRIRDRGDTTCYKEDKASEGVVKVHSADITVTALEPVEVVPERKLGCLSVSECLPMSSSDQSSENELSGICHRFMNRLTVDCENKSGGLSSCIGASPAAEDYYRSIVSLSAVKDDCWQRVLGSRVTSLAWCPLQQQGVVAVADKTGALGLWNMDNNTDSVQVLHPHRQGIAQVSFQGDGAAGGGGGQCRDTSCFTTSYDGITRRLDMERLVFDQVHALTDDELPAYTSGHVHTENGGRLLIGCSDGRVFGVDLREGSSSVVLNVGKAGVRSLSAHPTRQHLLLLVEKPRVISLWDVRQTGHSSHKSRSLWRHELPQSCHGAALDRVTGNTLVAACMDDSLRIFSGINALSASSPVKSVKSIRHDNHTGRWLTPLRPAWLPGSETRFLIGSMLRPRRVEIVDILSGRVCHMIMGEPLQSVLSTVACHPSLPMVAGANSSGRVYVFK